MKSIEVSAKTIEDAVSDGLQKLGCSISDCKVEILQEGAKGLFGFFGSKPATVRLTLTSDDDGMGDMDLTSAPLDARPVKQSKPKPEKQPAPARAPEKAPAAKKPAVEKNKMRIASNPQVVDRPSANEVLERFKSAPLPNGKKDKQPEKAAKPVSEKPAKPVRTPKPRPQRREEHVEDMSMLHSDDRTPVPAPEHIEMHDPQTLEGIAQQFLLGVTSRMGVQVQVDVRRAEDGHLFATMYGDTLGILIGRRGETLDALQYLTSLQVNRGREEYTRVTLDTENYREKREEALDRLANRMANRAVKTGRKVSLEPMNPYERRILHSSLQSNPNVTTHSEGDEPYRHVVVVPVK